jgi:hypothetical protein
MLAALLLLARLGSVEGAFELGETLTVPLLIKDVVPLDGVSTTLTVAVPPLDRVPSEHSTLPPVAVPQFPALVLIEVKVAPLPLAGKSAVNVTPGVGSGPLFFRAYAKVAAFPAPMVVTDGVTLVMPRSLVRPTLVTKASLGPLRADWNALPTIGKAALELVSPAT